MQSIQSDVHTQYRLKKRGENAMMTNDIWVEKKDFIEEKSQSKITIAIKKREKNAR